MMSATTTTTRLTYDALDHIPQARESDRHELIDGELFVTAAPIPLHQIVAVNFLAALLAVVRPARLGWVFTAPVDIVFSPDNVVMPDVGFVSRDRLHIIGPRSLTEAPDMLAEILSPSTRQRDLTQKKALYARFGVPEYWLFDPVPRHVEIHVLHDGRFEPLPITDGIARSTVIPGFAVPVADLFAMP